jgi:antitoxin (DNA-binding transcriptional repressor) of toxin-antitoxin stability system
MAIGRRAAYIGRMTQYTLAQAETRLSELMDRALNGEGVVITRGKASVELKVVAQETTPAKPKRRSTKEEELGFLRFVRAIPKHVRRAAEAEVRAMRDEGEA